MELLSVLREYVWRAVFVMEVRFSTGGNADWIHACLKEVATPPITQTPLHYKEANIRSCNTLMISDTDLEFNKGWKPFSEDSPSQDLSFLFIRWKRRCSQAWRWKPDSFPCSEHDFNLCISIFGKARVVFLPLLLRVLKKTRISLRLSSSLSFTLEKMLAMR